MTVAREHVIVFFPSVNINHFYSDLGKIFGFMHAQRVKNDCGAQVLFFSQV
jgi:hypothetical protein